MQRLGRYEILGELGRGAMGVVFRAEDPVIGRVVAIKTLRLGIHDGAHDELRHRLFREARSAGLLTHPHIVTVYDIGEDGDLAFIAMEYVQGPTLEEVASRQEPLPLSRIVVLLKQVAGALDYAHSRGIVHRDIKPGNIMISDSGGAKITDFGVAKIVSQQATQTGVMLGTPSYMSPEQIEGGEIDGRVDQFALSVIAYELLAGEKPFAADNVVALLFKIVNEQPLPVHRLNSTLDGGVSAVLERAMAKVKADRYPTCAAFVDALAEALQKCSQGTALKAGDASSQPTLMGEVRSAPAAPIAAPAAVLAPAPSPTPVVDAVALAQAPLPPLHPRARAEEPVKSSRGVLVAAMLALLVLAAGAALWFQYFRTLPAAEATDADSGESPTSGATGTTQAGNPTAAPAPGASSAKPAGGPGGERTPGGSAGTTPPVATTPGAPTAIRREPAKPEPGSADVEFVSNPPGARVRIDDTAENCVTPCSLELSAGRHVLHYELEGYHRAVGVVMVPQETTSSVRLDPAVGTLMIVSTPPEAEVLINGEVRGKTPATLKLPVGKVRVEVRKEGLPNRTRELEIRDGEYATYEVTWK